MRNRGNRCNKVLINVKFASERRALSLSGMRGSLKQVALWITEVARGASFLESAEAVVDLCWRIVLATAS